MRLGLKTKNLSPKSHHPENKTIITLGILLLLSGSFLIYLIPNVKGVVTNPSLTYTNTNSCSTCGATQDEFSLIQVGNGFNPATVPNQGLLNVVYCSGSTTTTLPDVSSITDTIGNTWTKVLSTGVGTVGTNDNAQKQFMNSIWQTNVVVTGSASFRITINFSPNAGNCYFILFLDTTGFLISKSFSGSYQYQKPGTGIFKTNLNILMSTSKLNTAPGSIVFSSDWINTTQTDPLNPVNQVNNLGLQFTNNIGLGAGASWLFIRDFYGFYSTGVTPPNVYQTLWSSTSSPANSNYPVGQSVVILQSTTLQPTNCNPNCVISGGAGSLSTTTFTLTANTTYYYVSNTGVGGITLNNISSKIASYTNGGAGKSLDSIQVTIYQSSCTVSGVPSFSLTCPYTNFGLWTFNQAIQTGTVNQWIHMPLSFSIPIPANSTYVIGIISKFSGLSLYTSLNIQPMFSTTEGTFTSTLWSPPGIITIQTVATPQIYMVWFGTINTLLFTSTSTSTSLATCSNGQNCITSTSTNVQVQTSYHYVSTTGASNINVIQDFETYFPVYIFALLLSPFGIQGIFIGFMMGVILGALLGVIPLWAAFLLSLGFVYLLSRR